MKLTTEWRWVCWHSSKPKQYIFFADNRLISIKVHSVLLKLCFSGCKANRNNLGSSEMCIERNFSIISLTSFQNKLIYLHSHMQCIKVPLELHFIHRSGMLLLYLFKCTGVTYMRISHLNCNILRWLFMDILWILAEALSRSSSLIVDDRSKFQFMNLLLEFSGELEISIL